MIDGVGTSLAERQPTVLFSAMSRPYLHKRLRTADGPGTMALMKNDLYRNLGVGFLLGAIGVVLTNPALAQVVTTLV